MSILLSLKNLNLTFGEKVIFKNAELTISKGDRIGLIGLNGQGKSTLFKILKEQVRPDTSTPPFVYDRTNEPYETFLIPQELDTQSFPNLTVEKYYLSFYPELYQAHLLLEKDPTNQKAFDIYERHGGWEIESNYINYLSGFELTETDRTIENLSGGERRKIALSVGLSTRAEFILWDEPTNHLDIETIERFEDQLNQTNKTYMIISHDRYLLNETTDRILHIEQGEITSFNGTYLDYLEYLDERQAELMKNLDKLENRHRRELAWMRQGIKARGTRSKKRVEGFHSIKSQIADIKSKNRKSVDLKLSHSGRKTKVLVQIEQGSFSYEEKAIFKDINVNITKKDKIALLGPNGSGKSTLVNILRQKHQLISGTQKNADDLKILVFDQNRESLDDNLTPMQIIGQGSDHIVFSDGTKQHINSYLKKFLFDSNQVNRPIATLSGGEKNRLQLALFMKQSADLWVFDEPTNDLDIETIELLEKELKSYDSAVILISHDRAFIDSTCSKTWLIHEKNIEVFDGGYTQVAPFLHAISQEQALKEQELKEKKNKLDDQNKKETPPKKKSLTHHEKQRKKLIDDEISDFEQKLTKVDSDLANFEYDNMTEQKNQELMALTKLKEDTEQKITELYEEWEYLNSDEFN